MGQEDSIEELVSRNLSASNQREYDYQGDFEDKNTDQALSILVHDAAVSLYERNEELNEEEAFNHISNHINERISESQNLDSDIIWNQVYGDSLNEVVQDAAEYYSENLVPASDVETEKVIENQGFHGRTDIIREVDGKTEIRDVKTKYSDKAPIPGPRDAFKMACYALISREGRDIDRFVLEYPLQGEEVEVEPEEWFAEVAEKANEFGEKLDSARNEQARIIGQELGHNVNSSPREFVENLGLSYNYMRRTAEAAVANALR